jgi:dTDP-glucose 4,6-dehydratase
MNLLVTGGCGFIGSNFIRYMLEHHPDDNIWNLDKLTYAGNQQNLKDIDHSPNYSFIKGDICDHILVDSIMGNNKIDTIVHFAAETHVDRSISGPSDFIQTNISGTFTLLENALHHGIERYIQVSTDEVYGSIRNGSFREMDNLNPSSPYSASKASGDLLASSYYTTFGLPVIITRCTNNYGPYQYPEKLIPLFTTNLIEGKSVPVYGSGLNIRDWLYVLDHCSAIDFLLSHGKGGEIYNIAGNQEKNNLEITYMILDILKKDESSIEYVTDRKGHDFRYSLDCGKLRSLGWQPSFSFREAMEQTISWYMDNEWWWRPLKN